MNYDNFMPWCNTPFRFYESEADSYARYFFNKFCIFSVEERAVLMGTS